VDGLPRVAKAWHKTKHFRERSLSTPGLLCTLALLGR
jgi:hypothetical protein